MRFQTQAFQVSTAEIEEIEKLIQEKEDVDYEFESAGYGQLTYNKLLELLREAGRRKELEAVDTFSIAEVFNIVSEYQHTPTIHSQGTP